MQSTTLVVLLDTYTKLNCFQSNSGSIDYYKCIKNLFIVFKTFKFFKTIVFLKEMFYKNTSQKLFIYLS